MSLRKLPPYPELPFPPAEKLNQNFILGEIRDHLNEFGEAFPHVNLGILLDQVTAVRRKNVDPEIQIRQFLQAFKNTTAFGEAFDVLDEETKKLVTAFRDGASADEVTRSRGFRLPPSSPAKHHFRLLDGFHSLFHHHDAKQPKGITATTEAIQAEAAKAPKIYEDADKKKIMKVSKPVAM